MVTSEVKIADKIADFANRLGAVIRVEVIILYGSQARGESHESSDIDLAVVSPDFEGKSTWIRQETIARCSVGRAYRISPIGFATSEYRDPRSNPFLREIIRTGRVVYEGD